MLWKTIVKQEKHARRRQLNNSGKNKKQLKQNVARMPRKLSAKRKKRARLRRLKNFGKSMRQLKRNGERMSQKSSLGPKKVTASSLPGLGPAWSTPKLKCTGLLTAP